MSSKKILTPMLISLWMLQSTIGISQDLSLQERYNLAKEAYQLKDYSVFYDHISKALEMHPYHQGIMYQKALAAVHMQKPEEAVTLLRNAILINTSFDLSLDDFNSLHEREDFKRLKELKTELNQPVQTSTRAFTISDSQLHAESITPGLKGGTFFVTSIHKRKVIFIDEAGTASDFIASKQDGLGAAMSVKVDSTTNSLWVASTITPEMMDYDSTLVSAVYQFDLHTRKLMARYEPQHEAKEFFFGDLILNKAGDVFVSDSRNNIIFKVNHQTKKLEPYFSSDEFWNIQGIGFSDDETHLFIADYIKGIFRLNLKTKELKLLPIEAIASAKGIDGLYAYGNKLIAIQNGVQPMRVMELTLNNTHDAIVAARTVDRAHADFNEPTNGCLVNNTLYYVANSQWNGYDEQKKIKPAAELQPIIILKSPLKP
jgi:tetratricopeptide (TPR) repeat protein